MVTFFIALALLIGGYFLYSRVAERAFKVDGRKTPAIANPDGIDITPMPKWKTFLIELLNIAGTGPIFGAISGALFGPIVFLWIVFGCILGGAVHDFFCGMISSRHNGASIVSLSGIYLGKVAKIAMRVFSVILLILVTVLMTFASMFVFDLPNYWNMQLTNKSSILAQFYEWFTEIMKQMTGGPLWSSFLVVAIFAPIFEEWMCRGMVLRGLLTKMKPGWAIVVSALFFAVIHMNPWQALNAFLIGLMMGYVYYKTGSLILTMVIHFVNNGTAVIASNIDALKDYEDLYWIEVMGKDTYFMVFTVSCIVLAACLWAFSRIRVENPWGNIDRIPPADETVAPVTEEMPTDEAPASEELPADEDPAVPAE